MIDALPVGVYVTDREHRVRLWNRKREVGTLGVPREEALGRTVFDVLPRQDATLVRRELDSVLATGTTQRLDTESTAPGEARTYRLSKIPMALGEGAPTHVITVGEDVTEWRAALDRSAQAEKLAAVGQLAAGVMHEINNPLATIAACAETMTLALAELPREVQPAGFGEYLRIVDHEVHRCRRIVDGLLNFSRAREPRQARVPLDAVVEQTLGLLRHHARFKRCAVRLDLAGGGAPGAALDVLGDPDQLTQIAMALLLNAADAVDAAERADAAAGVVRDGPRRGLAVRTAAGTLADGDAPPRPAAVLEIADEGVGMPRDVVAKIFDPFFTTKAPGEGTGLGLAICYGLVRDLGGRIDVESAPGEGTTFRVTLPAAGCGRRDQGAGTEPPGRGLGAEDEEHLGVRLVQYLRGRGYDVTLVRDGPTAASALRDGAFDAAVVDVQMPGADGFEVLAVARGTARPAEVVVASGNATRETAVAALRGGAYGVVAKPYRMAEVELVVQRAVETRRLRDAVARLEEELRSSGRRP